MKAGRITFIVIAVAIVVAAVYFRFDRLSLKPLHHDEGVNHYFIDLFLREGKYHYNPENFHGPLLYEMGYLPARFWGDTPEKLRTIPALLGVGIVLMLLSMRRWIGTAGALFAAAVAAASIADVYFSRTWIHEIYLAFFLTAFLRFLFLFLDDARLRSLYGVLLCGAAAFAIKETAALAVVAFVIAYVAAALFGVRREGRPVFDIPWRREGVRSERMLDAVIAAVVLWALCFSTFGTHLQGLADFFVAFIPWLKTGIAQTGHEKPWPYFFGLVGRYYWPLLAAAAFALVDVFRRKDGLAIFLFVNFVVGLVLYSLIPYKTPWCVVTMAVPLCPLAGIGATRAAELCAERRALAGPVLAITLAALAVFAQRSYDVNFERYDDDREPIVYVQTMRRFLDMFPLIDRALQKAGGPESEILIVDHQSPTKYYLRGYPNKTYLEDEPYQDVTAPVVIAHEPMAEKVRGHLGASYDESTYPVWPGCELVLFIRSDLMSGPAEAHVDPST